MICSFNNKNLQNILKINYKIIIKNFKIILKKLMNKLMIYTKLKLIKLIMMNRKLKNNFKN